jgi:hypothetical protein
LFRLHLATNDKLTKGSQIVTEQTTPEPRTSEYIFCATKETIQLLHTAVQIVDVPYVKTALEIALSVASTCEVSGLHSSLHRMT